MEIQKPIRVIADVTRKCNLNCYYCHSTSGQNYRGQELTVPEIRNVFVGAERITAFEITLTGGEPLLWANFREIGSIRGELDFCALQVITNATILTQEKLKWLKQARPDRICVSLDGPESFHDETRGKGTYSKTIDSIKKLRDIVDNITVISVLDHNNYVFWPELTFKLIDLGVKQHHLAPVCFSGNAKTDYTSRGLSDTEFGLIRQHVDKLGSKFQDEFILWFNDSLITTPRKRTWTLQSFTEQFKGNHVVVHPDGTTNWSVRAWGRDWRATETIGSIKTDSLDCLLDSVETMPVGFNINEEVARKFHIGTTDILVTKDLQEISLKPVVSDDFDISKSYNNPKDMLVSDWESKKNIFDKKICTPERYRVKSRDGYHLLFDRITFEVHILNDIEATLFQGIKKG